MWMLDRLQKGKVFMSESQSAMHAQVCTTAKPVKKDGHALEGIETVRSSSTILHDNSDTTELDEDESTT